MPDQDRIERALHPRWRRAYRLIKGRQPIELTADFLMSALAEYLREERGVPAFEELLTIANMGAGSPARAHRVGEAVRSVERRFAHSGHIKAAARGLLVLCAKVSAGTALPAAGAVAEEFCWQILDTSLLGKLDRLVGPKRPYRSVSDLASYRAQLHEVLAPAIAELARRLALDPIAASIRAPRSLRPRRSTRELIDIPVLVVEHQ